MLIEIKFTSLVQFFPLSSNLQIQLPTLHFFLEIPKVFKTEIFDFFKHFIYPLHHMCITFVCDCRHTHAIIHEEGWGVLLFCHVHYEHKLRSPVRFGNNCPYPLNPVAGRNRVLKQLLIPPFSSSLSSSTSCVSSEHCPTTAGWSLSTFVFLYIQHIGTYPHWPLQ